MLFRSRHRRGPNPAAAVGLAVAFLCMALPAVATAQGAFPLEDAIPRSPLELLIEHQDALNLRPDQIERLSAIRARLAAANDPLVARMIELRRQWQQERLAAQRAGRRPNPRRQDRIRAAAAPIHTRIQQNNRTAMQAVNRLLAPPQRARLRMLVEARRGTAASDDPQGEDGHGGAR
jgi:hypothetical protein